MRKSDAKFAVSLTDVWSVVTLAAVIGLVLTLAVRAPATAHQGPSVTIISSSPANPA